MQWTGSNDAAHALVLRMAEASFRAVVLAMLAGALAGLVRRSAAAKHLVWTGVLAGMLALPFLRPIVPAAHVPLLREFTPAALNPAPIQPPSAVVLHISAPMPGPHRGPVTQPWLWIAAAYLTGVALFAVRLAGGLVLTLRTFQDRRIIHPALPEYFERITHADPNVILEESDFIPVPLTIGMLHTRVILPSNWREWPQAKLDAILAHELAHARRSDPWIAFLASVNTCVFWFHPLAWWLRRRLAVLAEHAADDAALGSSGDCKAYALLLLETAAQLPKKGGRLALDSRAWHSVAMTGPVVAQRIRRVLQLDLARWKTLGAASRAMLIVTIAALILFTTAVDNKTLAAGQAQAEWRPPTAEQAAAWERAIAVDPDDQKAREQLIMYYAMYYAMHEPPDRALAHILWLIDHHPDSEVLGFTPRFITGPQLEEIQSHWAAQLALHPDDARVLINAAKQNGYRRQEEIDLLERARQLDPTLATEPLALLYSQILLQSTHSTEYAGLAAEVRFNVQSSNDIALVGAVATRVVTEAATEVLAPRSQSDFLALRALATELVTQAQALDPGNQQWSDLMEGVQALPEGR